MRTIGIGLAGMGTVGSGVYKYLEANRALLKERLGVEFAVRRVAVRDTAKARDVNVPAELLTTDPHALLDDPGIEIVVELMGGVDRAYEFVRGALERGRPVVTGNKALLAERGEELFKFATERNAPIFFEAAVAGGIPIIKALREAFVGNHILSIHGILNGTCNYILTRMAEDGLGFPAALREAQDLGYAEADPTLDINGWDAGHKAIILASLAYGFWVGGPDVDVEGISNVTADDIRFADQLGYAIKHLGTIKADADRRVEVSVHPTLIPKTHLLASVKGVFNAVAVNGDMVGEAVFQGRGAGQSATASAVISDLADAASHLDAPRRSSGFIPHGLYKACKPVSEIESSYYIRLSVDDRPGVLAQVARVLAENEIGISSVVQPESHETGAVPLVLMLHRASGRQMDAALVGIRTLDCVKAPPVTFRVETFGR
jgi:homoserine dehydrogenase